MALVELLVDGAADAQDSSMFIRCTSHGDAAVGKPCLRLELLCGSRMWRAEVLEKHKPAVLDCSGAEFLAALETAFTPQPAGSSTRPRFSYKWHKSVLTLSEHAGAGLSMKYASLSFAPVDDERESWERLLHGVVVESAHSLSETTRQKQRIRELEEMITKKDALLETALSAKQRLEEELFTKFCAVLNGKKEEIDRLQRDVAMASASSASKTAYKPKVAAKKRAAPVGKKKRMGAKLSTKKKATKTSADDESEEDEEDEAEDDDVEDSMSDSGSDSGHSASEDKDDSPTKLRSQTKIQRGAVNAYSQLASQIPMSSQVCAAADVLDDLDAIMKSEVERDDEQAASTLTTKKRPPPPSMQRTRSPEKKIKSAVESTPPSTRKKAEPEKPKPNPKPTSPPRKPVDSEEEDILDMLS